MSCKYWKYTVVLSGLLLASCADHEDPQVNSIGRVNPSISVDNSVATTQPGQTILLNTVDSNQFSLRLTSKTDGQYTHTWSQFSEFDADGSFAVGEYIAEAFYGDINQEGFELPYYYGAADVNVLSSSIQDFTIDCALANSMVRVEYTDAFLDYFEAFDVKVVTSLGVSIHYPANEDRPLFVKPGDITLLIGLTKSNGVSATLTPALPLEAEPRMSYVIKLDVETAGEGRLMVAYDTTPANDDISIDLSDRSLTSAAPSITTVGFSNGEPFTINEGAERNALMKVYSPHGLAGLRLRTNSKTLNSIGIPAECDLMRLSSDVIACFERIGFECNGVWSDVGTSATLDFSKLLANITDAEASFSLIAIDNLSKASEPVEMLVNVNRIMLEATNVTTYTIGSDYCDLVVRTNMTQVNPQYFNIITREPDGSSVTLKADKCVLDGDLLTLSFIPPAGRDNFTVDLMYRSDKKLSTTVRRVCPEYTLTVEPFATRAFVTINHPNPKVAEAITAQADFIEEQKMMTVIERDVEHHIVVVGGLTSSTSYQIKSTALYGNPSATYTKPVGFTTERMTQLEDGSFEGYVLFREVKDMMAGGRYSRTQVDLCNRQNYWSFKLYLPKKNWATVNDKTFSAQATNQNTWYVAPSTSLDFDFHTGSRAVKIQSVAYDPNGEAIPDYTQKPGEYLPYNPNVPEIRYRAAGKFFLGSYAYDPNTGKEYYYEGISFYSRPTTLNGYYKYLPGVTTPRDYGIVKVALVNYTPESETVVADGEEPLLATAGYSAFSVTFNYKTLTVKPNRLRIMFASTYRIGTIEYETSTISTYNDLEASKSVGSSLWVDDLMLGY